MLFAELLGLLEGYGNVSTLYGLCIDMMHVALQESRLHNAWIYIVQEVLTSAASMHVNQMLVSNTYQHLLASVIYCRV